MGNFPVLTTACLPPAGYIKSILQHTGGVIDEKEHFIKQTIRNHYEILSANGVLKLTVPVIHHAAKMPVHEVKISYAEPWQRLHLNAIKSAYGRSPFFPHYFPELEKIISESPVLLTVLNRQLLQWVFHCMKIAPSISFTQNYLPSENDYRHASEKHSDYFLIMVNNIRYSQVFADRFPFIKNLSIIDLIFNCGNWSGKILMES